MMESAARKRKGEAREQLKALGFRSVCTYEKMRPAFH